MSAEIESCCCREDPTWLEACAPFADLQAENEKLRHMLSACVVAHETGRYEPQRIAYEVALNWLRDNPSS